MNKLIFGSGDQIDSEASASNVKVIIDKDNNVKPNEQCGGKEYKENYKETYIIDSFLLPKKGHGDDYENKSSGSDKNSFKLESSSSNDTYDITDRISECKNLIDSFKIELNSEKNTIKQEHQYIKPEPENKVPCKETKSDNFFADLSYPLEFFTASVDTKLCSDKNLIEYEKQLQKYQRTLNVAHNAKKNAIRKQMLAKAFKLKLLEVENQCNIELLRIKQNLQCLEPLNMIAESWKTEKENIDLTKYNLTPLFPEIYASTTSESILGLDFEGNKDYN